MRQTMHSGGLRGSQAARHPRARQSVSPGDGSNRLRRRTQFGRAVVLATVAALVLGFAGCATPAQETLHLANEALRDGRPLDALVYATEALIQDEKLTSAKVFLRDHGTEELAAVEDFLDGSAGTTDPEYLERRYDTYGTLITF